MLNFNIGSFERTTKFLKTELIYLNQYLEHNKSMLSPLQEYQILEGIKLIQSGIQIRELIEREICSAMESGSEKVVMDVDDSNPEMLVEVVRDLASSGYPSKLHGFRKLFISLK